jgi:EmrB/QacA subfamily drug resistance transporter
VTSGRPGNMRAEPVPCTGPNRKLGWVTAAAIVGQLMVVLDIAVVNVATPSIRAALGFSAPEIQWVASGYLLTFAGFLLAGGRAADIYGTRRIFTLGLLLFTVASLGAGLSTSPLLLIGWRALQGLGAALLSPATLTVLITELQGRRQSRAVGAWASMSGVGGGLGVLAGGLLTQELSWRWIFFINVPLGGLTLAVAWTVLSADRTDHHKGDLDLPGAVTLTAGMVALVFALIQAEASSWTAPATIGSALAGALLLTVFWRIESAHARRPLVPLSRIRTRTLLGANVTVLLLYCVIIAPWFLFSYYMQTVLGFSPLLAGLGFLPQAAVIAGTAGAGSWIVSRRGPRLLVMAGPLLAAAGMLDLWWQVTGDRRAGYLAAVLIPLILLGLAVGCTLPAATLAATTDVPATDKGLASGLLNSSRQFGAALGLAILFTTGTARNAHTLAAHSVPTGYPTAALIGAGIAVAAFAAAFITFGITYPGRTQQRTGP